MNKSKLFTLSIVALLFFGAVFSSWVVIKIYTFYTDLQSWRQTVSKQMDQNTQNIETVVTFINNSIAQQQPPKK